jgi:imidazolonepropionase-like amidohydrolase
LRPFQSGHNPALARLFTEMVRRGTVLDATIWVYGPPPPGSNATAPTSCDERTGGIITEQAYRAGVAISAGTDNVSPYTDAWPELFHELDAMHTLAHMPVAAILRSATLVGARATGQERDIGGVAPGKLANMIVLERNPLESLANLQSLRMTIKRGRVFMRRDFAPLVAADITDF